MKKFFQKTCAFLLIATLLFGLCPFMPETIYAGSATGQQIVDAAKTYIGKVPYVWGGTTIDGANPGADCSGFICRLYEKFGFNFWANRTRLRNCGTNIGTDYNQAQLGDIIWYDGHVAIFAGWENGNPMIVQETGGNISNVVYSKARNVNAELKGIIRIEGITNGPSYVDVGTDFYAYIVNNNTDYSSWKHLGVSNGNVELQDVENSARQLWHFERQGDFSYKITNASDGHCLDDYNLGGSSSNVQTWEDNGSSAQRWFITGTSGDYQLHPACATNCSLDLSGGGTTVGTNVQIWETNGTGAQRMQIWNANNDLTACNITVSVNNKTATIKWDCKNYAEKYNVRIFKDALYSSADYTKWSLTGTSTSVTLDPGHYYAYVDSANTLFWKQSNIVEFNISETVASPTPSENDNTNISDSNTNNTNTDNTVTTEKPKTTSISYLLAISRKITIAWKRTSSIDGYQLQYSTNKNFNNATTVKVSKDSTLYTTRKVAKKKYYIRIRTYKTENQRTVYSPWSKSKSIKVTY